MLEKIDLSLALSKDEYRGCMPDLQARLFDLQRRCWEADVGVVIVFEGWEAAGRGSVIRKLTSKLEPRAFEINAIRGRRTHEQPLPWLYRFWVALPNYGRFAIFARSWNRRVLVHGLDGSLTDAEFQRAFDDIKSFEGALATDRYVVVKFFLHIDRDEQRRRLQALADDEAASWRVRDSDWEQNDRYDEHLALIEELLARTETEWAPWNLVAAHNLRWARANVIETVVERLDEELPRFEAATTIDGEA